MAIADQERRGGRHSANTRRKPASLSSTTRLASGDTQVAATHGFASCAMIRGLTLTCNINDTNPLVGRTHIFPHDSTNVTGELVALGPDDWTPLGHRTTHEARSRAGEQ